MTAEERFHKNMDLAYFMVHKHYYNTNPQDMDDLFQEALLGLWRACLSYDESRGVKFTAYAGRCIYNQVGMHLRPLKKRKGIQFITYDSVIDEDSGLVLEDVLGKPDDNISLFELLEVIDTLDEKEKEILRLKLEGLGQVEIGAKLECSQSYISRKLKNIKNKLAG